jgi:oligopeptide transport system substrate-binding protein
MKALDFKKSAAVIVCLTAIVATGCAEIKELSKPAPPARYYGEITPPALREFRWANGELPQTFDPAFAKTPAEMQAVRAVFDGLTELSIDVREEVVPAVAARWEATEDFRTWTFYLRPNAVWSNNKRIVAGDFVRSWQRLKKFGADSPHQQIISNIVGAQTISDSEKQNSDAEAKKQITQVEKQIEENKKQPEKTESRGEKQIQNPKSKIQNPTRWFGAEALTDGILRVYLIEPDKDFPRLAAHTALRPVFDDGDEFDQPETADKIITSGAFRIVNFDRTSGVTFERSRNYWNAANVKPERVRFVPTANADAALALYRAGQIDAVTSAHFEPTALKLLASYKDFRQTTFNAVTFYEFNAASTVFADKKVREALAIALDRERLVIDALDGAATPANDYLPQQTNAARFKKNIDRARALLAAAGYADGKNFPKIRLLINRNDVSNRFAKAVAAQWKKNLGIETEISQSSVNDLDNAEFTKDFDLIRRVTVLPTTDETANLRAMFNRGKTADNSETKTFAAPQTESTPNNLPFALSTPSVEDEPPPPLPAKPSPSEAKTTAKRKQTPSAASPDAAANSVSSPPNTPPPILTETQRVWAEIPAIPLYFPLSYVLVKPYVAGFEPNLLDAPALANVEIKTDWQGE